MKRSIPGSGMLFAALVAMVSVLAITSPTDAYAFNGFQTNFIVGMATTEVTLVPHSGACGDAFWHCDEGNHPNNTGLDMYSTSGSTGGIAVYVQAYGYSGYAHGTVTNHYYGASYCPGADVALWIPWPDSQIGTWVGYADYVQVNVTTTWGTGFYLTSGWTLQYLGTVYGVHPPDQNCIWTGIHLHQSGTSSNGYMWTNWPVDTDDDSAISGVQINPTGGSSYNFLHQIYY